MPYKDKEKQKEYMRVLMKQRRCRIIPVIPTASPAESLTNDVIPDVIPVIPTAESLTNSVCNDISLETEFYISLTKLKYQNRPFILWSSFLRVLNKEFLESYPAYQEHKVTKNIQI